MGLVRLLLIIVVAVLAYRMLRGWLSKRKPPPKRALKGGHMVACDHCGVFVPETEAVRSGQRFYCTEAHRRLHDDQGAANN
jgi:uncharacterized protein